ncbi:hypothetical protein DFQ27_000211 [Actinomortierella ambigua]|uniref:Uncharacterized protein n=1 Tax=Actinomortierella ambigua TaxID=1343610 RepID=A0A9P6PN02_9FUNG|nr:hypothetical protein DFQ27_000211 [Actinomortierella ambigua]
MKQEEDEEQPLPSIASTSNPPTAELNTEEKELINREARLNEAIDTNLRSNVDRDPRVVWMLYAFAFFYTLAITLLSHIAASEWYHVYEVSLKYQHFFRVFMAVVPCIGAVLSDSYLGKWWTLVLGTLTFQVGAILVVLFSIPNIVGGGQIVSDGLSFMPLAIVALGAGFIAPTIEAFGGDQFLAIQDRGRDRYFSLLYFVSGLAYVLARFIFSSLQAWHRQRTDVLLRKGSMHNAIVAACSTLVLFPIVWKGRRRFRMVSSMHELVPFKVLKTAVVAISLYVSAWPTERAAATHWLNFASRSEGSLFVQELYDSSLALAPILLPTFCFFVTGRYADRYDSSASQYFLGGYNALNEAVGSEFHSFNYVTLVLVLLLAFVVYPFANHRGWNVSLYRRMGAGYVSMMVATVLSVIVHDAAAATFYRELPSGMRDGYLYGSSRPVCQTCISPWVSIPPFFFMAMAFALVMPTAAQVVFIESGPHLRTLAMAVWIVFQTASDEVSLRITDSATEKDTRAMHIIFGSISVAGIVLYLTITHYYTPRKQRASINNAAHLVKEAEFAKP